jgi:hypothetical protein
MNPKVDRCLADKVMDNIDHALGRPVNPLGETWRNHFATDGAEAALMAASPFWKDLGTLLGDLQFFAVTMEGREALAAHLRVIEDPYRAYVVTFDGSDSVVAAKSPGAAKYRVWLSTSDCVADLAFGTFCRSARVRRAA